MQIDGEEVASYGYEDGEKIVITKSGRKFTIKPDGSFAEIPTTNGIPARSTDVPDLRDKMNRIYSKGKGEKNNNTMFMIAIGVGIYLLLKKNGKI